MSSISTFVCCLPCRQIHDIYYVYIKRVAAFVMITRIKGVVLRVVKYKDTDVIVDMYTDVLGRASFAVRLPKRKTSGSGGAVWRPLSIVEFECDVRERVSLLRPRDVRVLYNYMDLPYNPFKSTVALFLSEFLCAVLRSEEGSAPLFLFLTGSLEWFDRSSEPCPDFHLVFLVRLSLFLGIYPNMEGYTRGDCFNLVSGCLCSARPAHTHFLGSSETGVMRLLLSADYSSASHLRFSRTARRRALDVLCEYYGLHVPGFPELKSLSVLESVFD